jgi:hypothetical protein
VTNVFNRNKKGQIMISIIDLVYLGYIVRLVTGMKIADIIRGFLDGSGSITDKVLDFALAVLDRLESEGIEIAVEGGVVTWAKKEFQKLVGRKQFLDIGFAVVTM